MVTETLSRQVAAEVRAHLARRGLKGVDLAACLECSQQSASDRLNGRVKFTLDELDRIATWVGVSPTDFFPTPVRAA
jgi:antitoxin component HigA of HigAB toxin-antitoxin module